MPMKLVDHEVHDHKSFYIRLTGADIPSARALIIIQSPFIFPYRVKRLEPFIIAALRRGVIVCAILQDLGPEPETDEGKRTRAAKESAIQRLKDLGVHVCFRSEIHEKIIVIDEHILYEGSLNPLSQNTTSERMNRWADYDMVQAAIKMHKLDTCEECLSMRLSTNSMELLRQSFRQHRKALGLSQRDLAQISGIAQSTISYFEAGRLSISLKTLDKLCMILNASIRSMPKFMAPALDMQLREFYQNQPMLSTPATSSSLPFLRSTIVLRRQSLLLTQKGIAAVIGINQKTVSSLESHSNSTTLDIYLELCDRLNLAMRLVPTSLATPLDLDLNRFWLDERSTFESHYKEVQRFMKAYKLSRMERLSNRYQTFETNILEVRESFDSIFRI